MKTKRNDIRLSRKTKPRKYVNKHSRKNNPNSAKKRSLSNKVRTKSSGSKIQRRRSSSSLKQESPLTKDTKTSHTLEVRNGSTESRRKRTDTSEYIKKRFLYDSDSHINRSNSMIGVLTARSASLQTKRAFHTGEHLNNLTSSHRIKRGRKLKQDLDIKEIDSAVQKSVSESNRREKNHKRSLRKSKHVMADSHVTSEILDQVKSSCDSLRHRKNTSNTRLSELDESHDFVDSLHRDLQSRKFRNENHRLFGTIDQERTFSIGSDIPDNSLLDFSDDNSGRYDSRQYDSLDANDDDYLRPSLLHDMPEPRNQPPNEDLEEEDLLAPELSILAGPTTLAGADGVIVSNPQTLFNLSHSSGASRRKSPVRPMQVIRTKPAVPAPSTMPVQVLSGDSDTGTFIYNQSPTYSRHLSGDDSSQLDEISTFYHHRDDGSQSLTVSPGMKSASIMHPSGNLVTTSIKVRPLVDRIPSGDENDNKTVTANIQFGSRTFVGNSRSIQTTSAKPTVSHTHSSGARRRPTILKRGAHSSSGSSHIPTGMDLNSESSQISSTRSIGAFTPSSTHSRKPSLIQSSPATVTSTLDVGPTKLLQLVTASSMVAPIGPTPLTASDKLFGRRNPPHCPAPMGAAGIVPVPKYLDGESNGTRNTVSRGHPYRYAVLRGGPDGKRYLVLGSSGALDKSAVNSVNSAASKSIENRLAKIVVDVEEPSVTSVPSPSVDGTATYHEHCNPQSDSSADSELPQSHVSSICGTVISSAPGIMVSSVVAT